MWYVSSELDFSSKVNGLYYVLWPLTWSASVADSYNGLKGERNTAYPKEISLSQAIFLYNIYTNKIENALKYHAKHLVFKLHFTESLFTVNVLDAPSWLKKHVAKLF